MSETNRPKMEIETEINRGVDIPPAPTAEQQRPPTSAYKKIDDTVAAIFLATLTSTFLFVVILLLVKVFISHGGLR